MAKAEISWRRLDEEGQRLQCYAQRVGREYRFFKRHRRYDNWERVENPPLEDWLELLDSVQRRVQRMLLPPDEEVRVKKMILDRYPGTKFGARKETEPDEEEEEEEE